MIDEIVIALAQIREADLEGSPMVIYELWGRARIATMDPKSVVIEKLLAWKRGEVLNEELDAAVTQFERSL